MLLEKNMEDYSDTLRVLKSYNYLGESKLDNGTLLIGKAPHIAPLAWLHVIYPPLTEREIKDMEASIGKSLPNDYVKFLRITNGLGVFNTTFSLYGRTKNFKRSIDSMRQPFSIITPNTKERPKNARPGIFIIGSYDWNGSYLYIDSDSDKVHVCERGDVTSLYEWNNFDEMIQSEVKRICTLFDKEGKALSANDSTLPMDY